MEVGEHFHVIFTDNTGIDGVLEGVEPSFLKFFSMDDGQHFYIPLRSIKMLESYDEGPADGWGGPDDDDDDEPDFPSGDEPRLEIRIFKNGEQIL